MSPTAKPRPALSVFPSALGWMAIVTRDGAIVRLTFGHRRRKAALAAVAACFDAQRGLSQFSFQRKWDCPLYAGWSVACNPSPAAGRTISATFAST